MNGIVIENKKGVAPEDFQALAWVLRARSREEERLNLCGVHSDGMGKFEATDGHRIHVAEIPSFSETIPAGIWIHVSANKKKISLQQTEMMESAFPKSQMFFDEFNLNNPTEKGFAEHIKGEDSSVIWRVHGITDMEFNIKYLIDVLSEIEPLMVRVCKDYLKGIEFSSDRGEGNTKRAIIMPFKKL